MRGATTDKIRLPGRRKKSLFAYSSRSSSESHRNKTKSLIHNGFDRLLAKKKVRPYKYSLKRAYEIHPQSSTGKCVIIEQWLIWLGHESESFCTSIGIRTDAWLMSFDGKKQDIERLKTKKKKHNFLTAALKVMRKYILSSGIDL